MWIYRTPIVIDNTKVSGTGDLTDFPVLISGTYDGTGGEADLRSVANGGNVVSANAYDIGFYANSTLTTPLKYERELHDVSTGQIIYWVKVPTLDGDADTTIYITYGDGGITTDQQDIQNTWNSNYGGVWHMAQDPTNSAPQITDSTANNKDGTVQGTGWASGHLTTGPIYKALELDPATDQFVTLGVLADPISNKITMSCWVNLTNPQTDPDFGLFGSSTSNGTWLGSTGNGGARLDDQSFGTLNVGLGTWKYVVVGSNGTQGICLLNGSHVTNSPSTGTYTLHTGKSYSIGTYDAIRLPKGLFAEVRYMPTYMGDDWYATEYNNQSDPATFYSMGTPVNILQSGIDLNFIKYVSIT